MQSTVDHDKYCLYSYRDVVTVLAWTSLAMGFLGLVRIYLSFHHPGRGYSISTLARYADLGLLIGVGLYCRYARCLAEKLVLIAVFGNAAVELLAAAGYLSGATGRATTALLDFSLAAICFVALRQSREHPTSTHS